MRRPFFALVVLVLIGVVALGMTFRPASLPLTPLPVFAEPVAHVPPTLTIAAIRSGVMTSNARFAYRGGADEERSFAMGAILVRHPRGDLLIDAGFGRNVDQHV